MGYNVHLRDGKNFKIEADKVEACRDAVAKVDEKSNDKASEWVEHFAYLPAMIQLIEMVNHHWSLRLVPSVSGAINGVVWEGEKMRNFDKFCSTIAPFVVSESYLEFCGEDGERWRYLFRDGSYVEQKPKIIWE